MIEAEHQDAMQFCLLEKTNHKLSCSLPFDVRDCFLLSVQAQLLHGEDNRHPFCGESEETTVCCLGTHYTKHLQDFRLLSNFS